MSGSEYTYVSRSFTVALESPLDRAVETSTHSFRLKDDQILEGEIPACTATCASHDAGSQCRSFLLHLNYYSSLLFTFTGTEVHCVFLVSGTAIMNKKPQAGCGSLSRQRNKGKFADNPTMPSKHMSVIRSCGVRSITLRSLSSRVYCSLGVLDNVSSPERLGDLQGLGAQSVH